MSGKPTCEQLARKIHELEKEVVNNKKLIRSLRESGQKYRLLAENVSDIIWTLDLNLKTTYVSPSITKILGFTPAERMCQDAAELMTPESYKKAVDTLAREMELEREGIVDPDRSHLIEIEYYHKDGYTVWTENIVRWMRNDKDDIVGIYGVSRDITDRKKIEEALRQSEIHYRSLFNNSLDAFLFTAPDGSILDANPAACKMFGRSVEEIRKVGRNGLVDITDPRLQKALEERARTGKVNAEITMIRSDGTNFPVEITSTIFTDQNGLEKTSMIIRDITERKRAEEALQERDTLFKKLSSHVPGMIYQFKRRKDGSYCAPFSTDAIKDIFGCSPQDVCEDFSPIARVILPEDLDKLIHTIEYSAQNMTLWECEYRAQIPGKPVRWLFGRSSPEKLDDGSIIWHGYNTDITEYKRLEENLRSSEEIFSKFMEHSPVYVFFKDEQLRAVRLSANYETMLGRPVAELLGKSVEELFPSDLASNMAEDDRRILREGKLFEVEEELNERNYYTIKFPIQTGKLQYLAGFTIDITDQKRADKEREKLQAQLTQAQKMEAVGRLAGGVAHDFNNMLGVIIGYAEMALSKIDPNDPIHADLTEILMAGKRSSDLTRQLLAFARRQTINPRIIDLNDTIEGALKMLRRIIGENIDLSWRPGANLWSVLMDPAQLDQVLANLCVNARDAIDGVGKVTIETENTRFDEFYCQDHDGFVPGEYVLLAVSDDGCGMDKETLDKIFEPFFTTKGVGDGTGLGLATVYGIVKQNSGFINVYSEPGKGSTFKIYLPRQVEKAADAQEIDPMKIPSSHGETVLVVEDEASIRRLCHTVLEGLGYRTLVAGTPKEAINLVKAHVGKIHLLITDVVMPEMNGRELSEKLQKTQPDIKTLFMSGYTSNVIAHRGVLDKGVDFIPKPFTRRALAIKVRKVLDDTDG